MWVEWVWEGRDRHKSRWGTGERGGGEEVRCTMLAVSTLSFAISWSGFLIIIDCIFIFVAVSNVPVRVRQV